MPIIAVRLVHLGVLLAALGVQPAAAQGGRVSLELTGGRGTNSPIFEHEVRETVPARTSLRRLSLDDAFVVSARVGYRVTGSWTLVGEVGEGPTDYSHSWVTTIPGVGVVESTEQWGSARRTMVSLGLAHRFTPLVRPLSIEPELGVAMQRLRVGNPGVACVPQPPSLGGYAPCVASERWERTYSVPSVGAGLALGYTVLPRVDVQLRGRYSVGRTSTREGFFVDLIPQYDFAEAPTSQTVRSTHLSVGLRIAP